MNNVTLIGRITHDLEIKVTPNNSHVMEFSIAVKRETKDDATDFFNIQSWGKQADYISEYATKGTKIAVNGKLREDKYTDKDGNNRRKTYVLSDRVEILSNGKSKVQAPTVEDSNQEFINSLQGTEYANQFGAPSNEIADDDLPF